MVYSNCLHGIGIPNRLETEGIILAHVILMEFFFPFFISRMNHDKKKTTGGEQKKPSSYSRPYFAPPDLIVN